MITRRGHMNTNNVQYPNYTFAGVVELGERGDIHPSNISNGGARRGNVSPMTDYHPEWILSNNLNNASMCLILFCEVM